MSGKRFALMFVCMLSCSGVVLAQRSPRSTSHPRRTPPARESADAGVARDALLWCMPSASGAPQRCVRPRASCESRANALSLVGTTPRTCTAIAATAFCYELVSVHVRSAVLPEYVCFDTAAACQTDRARSVADPRMSGEFDIGACAAAATLAPASASP